MDAAVVYESMFGNTREVAEAIAAGIRESGPIGPGDGGAGGHGETRRRR